MGRKTRVAQASLAAAFIAAGGAAAEATADSASPNANIEGVISSYFGPLGLRDDFQHYIKLTTGFENFNQFHKADTEGALGTVIKFSNLHDIAPPPIFGDEG